MAETTRNVKITHLVGCQKYSVHGLPDVQASHPYFKCWNCCDIRAGKIRLFLSIQIIAPKEIP